MRVVTWNMSHWSARGHADRAWAYLADLDPDITLLQEAQPLATQASRWTFVPEPPWEIDTGRKWGSGVATRAWAMEPIDHAVTPFGAHEFVVVADGYYRGALAVAGVDVSGFGNVVAISVYALMKPIFAQTTLLRMIADLIPLFDASAHQHYLLGGDLNIHTQTTARSDRARYAAILHAVESLGLVNCFKTAVGKRSPLVGCTCNEETCYHARTHLHARQVGKATEAVGGHNDYLFASPALAERLTSLRVMGDPDEDPDVWQFSDHCPVVAEFDVAD